LLALAATGGGDWARTACWRSPLRGAGLRGSGERQQADEEGKPQPDFLPGLDRGDWRAALRGVMRDLVFAGSLVRATGVASRLSNSQGFKPRASAILTSVYYTKTRFFRFLVSLRKITQHGLRSTYSWVPRQPRDRDWTDAELFAKYGITPEEQAYIASQIRPMNVERGDDE